MDIPQFKIAYYNEVNDNIEELNIDEVLFRIQDNSSADVIDPRYTPILIFTAQDCIAQIDSFDCDSRAYVSINLDSSRYCSPSVMRDKTTLENITKQKIKILGLPSIFNKSVKLESGDFANNCDQLNKSAIKSPLTPLKLFMIKNNTTIRPKANSNASNYTKCPAYNADSPIGSPTYPPQE